MTRLTKVDGGRFKAARAFPKPNGRQEGAAFSESIVFETVGVLIMQ